MYYNSWDESSKKPFGACAAGSKITFKFYGEKDSRINLNLYNDNNKLSFPMEALDECKNLYTFSWNTPGEPSLWWYYFEVNYQDQIEYFGNNEEAFGGEGKVYNNNPVPYQITLFKAGSTVPEWYKEGIIYQIFVDRFFNGNDEVEVYNPRRSLFFKREWNERPAYIKDQAGNVEKYDFYGGNLKGIIKKLPYLKTLGISIIYLNPIFESWSNHKYDTADYLKIDSMYGEDSDFDIFIEECRKNHINVILDGVFNHTGTDSIYFNKEENYTSVGAYNSKESPYYSWYMFKDYPKKYDSWWGIESMPAVNKNDKDYRSFIMHDKNSVIHHWMNKGIKGWRLDVVDELPDDFVSELRKEVKDADNQSILIGEVWEDASNKISYGVRRKYFLGEELDSVMNYPFRNIVISFLNGNISGEICLKKFMSMYENYPQEYFYSTMNLLGSHDVSRIFTELGAEKDKVKASQKMEMAALFQMTFPGVPSIYYGDEAGSMGNCDPDNRRTYPWGNEDKELLFFYGKVTRMRQSIPALKKGKWIPLHGDKNIFAYMRCLECENYIILFNNDNSGHTISIPLYDFQFEREFLDIFTGEKGELISEKLVITIFGTGFKLIMLKNRKQ